jgi:hypothetical protein
MAHGHLLGLRLFLEGVEVPVIAAQVSVSPNAPTVASVQVIGTDQILKLLPRTVVHLFFYDFVDTVDPAIDDSDPKDISSVDYLNSKYKLLFMGEVQGITMQKDAGSRACVLQCVDFSNYWDTTYQYNFKGSLLGGRKHAAFIGANSNFFTSPLGHGVGTIAALLNGKSVNFPNLKGLLAGIIRCLEAIGGSYYGEKTFKGANDFTSIAELRLKVLQQICAAEKDSSTAKLFARKAFNMWMNRQMGGLSKLVTFRGITQILQRFIFHEIFPNPCARYIPRVDGLKKTKTWAIDIEKDPRARTFIKRVKAMKRLLQSAQTNLNALNSTSPPSDAAIKAAADLTQTWGIYNKAAVSVPKIKGLEGKFVQIDGHLQNVRKHVGGPARFHFILDPRKSKSRVNLNNAIKEVGRALDAIAAILGQRIKKSRQVTYSKLDRVNNQILRPDIWFAPAPRCNVLFPDMYNSFNWSRNFLREVSRLELQTTNEVLGDDALFNGRYYAPNVVDMRKGLRLSSRRFGRLIMKHELLTGIIPMFEKITEANLFAMKSRKVKHKGAKVGYAQRAVNFQYFKHRFASRQMSAAGRLNPWFVPGFPAVLIDRPMNAEQLAIASLPVEDQLNALDITPDKAVNITRATLLQYLVPTQYVGSCVALTHTLGQQGGNTSYAFQQARVHREGTEYLGVDKATISKKVGTARKKTLIAAPISLRPKKGSKGPRGGRITETVLDRTDFFHGKKKSLQIIQSRALGVVGEFPPPYYFKDLKGEARRLRAYEVVETFTRRAKVKIDLPIEEAIRPPWIWDGWTNLKIGETYMQFFGTNSITDVEGYTSKELLESAVLDSEGYEALAEAKEGVLKREVDGQKKPVKTDLQRHEDKVFGSDPKMGDRQEKYMDKVFGSDKNDSRGETRKNKPTNRPAGTTQQEETQESQLSVATLLTLEKERTIENSIDYLVRVYSLIQSANLDLGEFIRNFTWRPVATMVEIMGSENFVITEDPPNSGTYKTSGDEGFHSRAFGDQGDLFGLVNPKVKKVLGLGKEKRETAKRLDVRGLRRKVVREYADELATRGLLG